MRAFSPRCLSLPEWPPDVFSVVEASSSVSGHSLVQHPASCSARKVSVVCASPGVAIPSRKRKKDEEITITFGGGEAADTTSQILVSFVPSRDREGHRATRRSWFITIDWKVLVPANFTCLPSDIMEVRLQWGLEDHDQRIHFSCWVDFNTDLRASPTTSLIVIGPSRLGMPYVISFGVNSQVGIEHTEL